MPLPLPHRTLPPRWMLQPLGRSQPEGMPWPRAWASALLVLTGVLHVLRALWVTAHSWPKVPGPVVIVGIFGLCYFTLGLWLRRRHPRALWWSAAIVGLGLVLGSISFIVSFESQLGVNWSAVAMLLLDVLILPLCLAGLRRSH